MKHIGDITKISGTMAPMVHIITGGSPCQDLSVAGKRAGLAGERSGLFMEQIRIIKEMRNESKRQLYMLGADVDIRHIQPRYTVWENVYGAFSSNNGEDFRAVLEETVKVADESAYVPGLEKGQKWASAGCIMGDGYSVAWRVHDAQFWGVPQRRRRLCVLADYGGATAPEILFEFLGEAEYTEAHKTVADFGEQSQSEVQLESTGLPWDINQSTETRKGTSGTFENCLRETGCAISFQERAGKPGGGKGILIQNERTGALSTLNNQSVFCIEGNGKRESHQGSGYKESDTMYTLNTVEQHAVAYRKQNEPITTSKASYFMKTRNEGTSETLVATDYKDPQIICYEQNITRKVYDWHRPDTRMTECSDVCVTAAADWGSGGNNMPYVLENENLDAYQNLVVRRLTPLECARLQGYPDGWMDIGEWTDCKGKQHKDSDAPKYKAAGNSIALPFWQWLMDRISAQLKKDGIKEQTMASLFDGIGGFPLVSTRVGIKPLWCSEIEEFPMAVTKKHFNEAIDER